MSLAEFSDNLSYIEVHIPKNMLKVSTECALSNFKVTQFESMTFSVLVTHSYH